MRFVVVINLKDQSVEVKIENGKSYSTKIGASAYFAAPNPLPHPTLANYGGIITALENALNAAKGGGDIAQQTLKTAETNYDNATTELAHYVEDRANADPLNGDAIITAAGMTQKSVGAKFIPDFKATPTGISGELYVRIKATRSTTYVLQLSPNPATGADFVWHQVKVSQYASFKIEGLVRGQIVWLRYARIIGNVPSDFSDPMSVVVM